MDLIRGLGVYRILKGDSRGLGSCKVVKGQMASKGVMASIPKALECLMGGLGLRASSVPRP